MSGLNRITKAYGGITIQGNRYVWDYVADKAIPENEMPIGSERWIASERKRWESVKLEMINKSSLKKRDDLW